MTAEQERVLTDYIPLDQVETRLQQLWAAEGIAGAVRARTRNVVVVLEEQAPLESTIDLFIATGSHHPSRIILLTPNPETPDPGIAASPRLVCPTGGTPSIENSQILPIWLFTRLFYAERIYQSVKLTLE